MKNLLDTKPVKRENVKVKNPKNREKLIPRRSRLSLKVAAKSRR